MPSRRAHIPTPLKALLASVSVALLLTGCGLLGPQVETEVYETADGAIVVQSVEVVATVERVDARKRELRINPKHGLARVLKVGDSVNLRHIQVGDEVHIELVEAIAVSLLRGGAAKSAGELAAVSLAPQGHKPGLAVVDTREITATIVGIDGYGHRITLELVDGTTQDIKVSRKLDLSELELGDSIRVAVTDAVAISVVKPR
jgi:hypothetical protein